MVNKIDCMTAIHNQTATENKRLFSIKELPSTIGGTVWYWRQAIWSGELPVVKFGKKQLVDMKDIESFIQKYKEINVS